MAAVLVTINGVICDLYGRVISGPVKIMGEMMRSDVGVGGGPVFPPEGGEKPPRPPVGIWPGPGDPDFPGDGKPPRPPVGIWPGPGPLPHPEHPIVIPPDQVPPEAKPPTVPPPGTVTPIPPPAGSGGWPTTGIVPPQYVVLYYPGIGPVVVTAPPHAEPA